MKAILKKEHKKAAIVVMNGRIMLNTVDVEAVQLFRIKKSLEQMYDREVDFVSYAAKKNEKLMSCYKDIKDTDLNDYDEIFINESGVNTFGGTFSMFNVYTIKKLAMFDAPNYKKPVYYILSDPRFPCKNFAEVMRYKMTFSSDKKSLHVANYGYKGEEAHVISEEEIDCFTKNIFNRIITCFNGYDYDAYQKQYYAKKRKVTPRTQLPTEGNWCNFVFFEHFAKELSEDKNIYENYSFEDKKYDLCYYGHDRKNERNLVIAELYKSPKLSKFFIDFNGVKLDNVAHIERTSREDLFPTIAKNCLATLVVGDDMHNNNCITFRFYETMLMDVVALIYHEYDVNKNLIKDKFLQEFAYVKTSEDVEDRIKRLREDKSLYQKIVELERAEVKRLVSSYSV